MDELDLAPDYHEAIIGWRCWGIAQTEEGIRLCSPRGETQWRGETISGTIWTPGEQWVAQCEVHEDHEPPEPGCTCGIYSLSAGIDYYDYEGGGYAVIGELGMWGRIIEGRRGYRAQFAYPRSLWLAHRDYRFAEPLGVYGVPVRLCNPFAMKFGES